MKVEIGPYPSKDGDKRVESVRIDRWDIWSLDYTLATIILPALKKFKKASSHGVPGNLIDWSYHDMDNWSTPAFRRAEKRATDKGAKVWDDALCWAGRPGPSGRNKERQRDHTDL